MADDDDVNETRVTPSDEVNEQLLKQYSTSRSELTKYITDLDNMKTQIIDQLAPNTSDYRSRFALEEKVKTITSFYGTILSFRQEFSRNVKEEIELRRKLEKGEGNEADVDIEMLADKMEKIINQRKSLPATSPQPPQN